MAENLNIYQKIAKIGSLVDVVLKNKQGYGYTYSDINEILAKVTTGMKKHGVILIPSIVPGTTRVTQHDFIETKTDKSGKQYEKKSTEMSVCSDMVFKWVNVDNPNEIIEVPWTLVGMQSDPSQAFGSGLTYIKRYFLTQFFNIAQDNDVDGYRSKQKAAEAEERSAVLKAILDRFDSILRQYLSDNEDKAQEVKKFISKYAKAGDYRSIKDPDLAGKLLRDFTEIYIDKEGKEE